MTMVPHEMIQGSGSDPSLDVTIIGDYFMGSQARLGQSIQINVLTVTHTTIDGLLARDIPVGVYGLTVENSDGQQGVLSGAFTVYPRPHPTSTLDSEVAYVNTFGSAASPTEGDDDHVQIIFFEVPNGPDDLLYIRIFDADTGGAHDETGPDGAYGDTAMTYTLRGGGGAYTTLDARSHHPGPPGIASGTLTAEQVVGVDGALDDNWLTLSVRRNDGELIGESRIIKLVVQGTSGDDGNWYQVAISSDPNDNIGVAGARLFAFSWCVALPGPRDEVTLYPFVPTGANLVTQVNFDYDVSPGAAITLSTPLRDLPVTSLSGDGDSASEEFIPSADEKNATWTARYASGDIPPNKNDFSVWFLGDNTYALAIFTKPTLVSPP